MAMHSDCQTKCPMCIAACTLLAAVLHMPGVVLQSIHRCGTLRSCALRVGTHGLLTGPSAAAARHHPWAGHGGRSVPGRPQLCRHPQRHHVFPGLPLSGAPLPLPLPCLLPSPMLWKPVSGQSIMHVLQHTGQLGLVLRICSAASVLQGAEDSLPFIQHAKACVPACRLAAT